MGKKAVEFGALDVSRLVLGEPHPKRPETPVNAGLHFVGGVPGLAMQVAPGGARSWVLRLTVGSKRRDMGLGSFPGVTLADARRRAREEREARDKGKDPIGERRAAKARLKADQALQVTFSDTAKAYIRAHEASWGNARHAVQWTNSLKTYAEPILGNMSVNDITTANVLSVLEPIWVAKSETASRVRSRIECVLDYAASKGQRAGVNPARWRGNLDATLPRRSKVSPVEHHPALPVGEVGAFMERLRGLSGMSALALEFLVLTAARSGETRGALWSEIDLDAAVWVVPGARMKMKKEHRVPLSPAAVTLLKSVPIMAGIDLVFPAVAGTQLSDMAMTAVTRRLGAACVPHGFRSTFRDWAAERTTYPGELAELALAHAVPGAVEAAYRRGTQFEKRRQMMVDWSDFVSRPEVKGATVVPINSKGAA